MKTWFVIIKFYIEIENKKKLELKFENKIK